MNKRKLKNIIKENIINPLQADKKTIKKIARYDRNAARVYAETYAESPNLKQYPHYKDDDSTNFVSQVLRAGGLEMTGVDYTSISNWFCYTNDNKQIRKVSHTWRNSRYFRKYWGNENGIGNNLCKKYIELPVEEALRDFENLYKTLQIGDVIQYGDVKNENMPYHSQVIHGKYHNSILGINDIFVAQHSANRKNVSLYQYLKLLQNKSERRIYLYYF